MVGKRRKNKGNCGVGSCLSKDEKKVDSAEKVSSRKTEAKKQKIPEMA